MTMQRFSKGAGPNKLSYPITREQMRALKPCKLVSVRVGRSHGIPMPPALCNSVARAEALAEVMHVRQQVQKGTFPRAVMEKYYPEDWGTFPKDIPAPLARAHETFNLPAPLSFDDPQGLASVVHMDNPLDLARVVMDYMIDEGVPAPHADGAGFDFIDTASKPWQAISDAVQNALNMAFEVKYYYGLPRPEEVAGENMTHYPEGCPNHPTFPAGHGAVAFDTIKVFLDWLEKAFKAGKIKVEKYKRIAKELFDSAYVWSMARMKAGVHFAVDNLPFAPRRAEYA